jgi:hypothetical protein
VDGPPVTTDAKAKGSAESIGASDSHEDCTRSSSRDKEIARVGERRIVLDYDAYSAAITVRQPWNAHNNAKTVLFFPFPAAVHRTSAVSLLNSSRIFRPLFLFLFLFLFPLS